MIMMFNLQNPMLHAAAESWKPTTSYSINILAILLSLASHLAS